MFKKSSPIFLPLFLFFFVVTFLTNQACADETIKGHYCYTYGDNETLKEARELTRKLTVRNATESYRIYVASKSKIKDFQIIDDLIDTISTGYLKNIKVTEHSEKDRTICETIEGQINASDIDVLIAQLIKQVDTETLTGTISKEKETPHYDVVAEYIRALGANHNIQQKWSKDHEDNKDNRIKEMMNAVRSGTRFKLELRSSISALKRMSLKKPFDELLLNTISFYELKMELYEEIVKISKKFVDADPKPDVDYSKMVARMPEITAQLEYIDESIFQSMVLVFALLIDEKPDSEGHMSHLNITKAQRQKFIDNINGSFGESLDKNNQTWTVRSASLLKAYLLKDYKCADEW
jgi:hypothetical protein